MFKAIGIFFRAIGRIFNIIDILAKEGEETAKGFAKENAVLRAARLAALERGEDPDADA